MLHINDHKPLDMFDRFGHLGPQRRQLLGSFWAKLFRDELSPHLPVHLLSGHFDGTQGRPSYELFAMMGSMIPPADARSHRRAVLFQYPVALCPQYYQVQVQVRVFRFLTKPLSMG